MRNLGRFLNIRFDKTGSDTSRIITLHSGIMIHDDRSPGLITFGKIRELYSHLRLKMFESDDWSSTWTTLIASIHIVLTLTMFRYYVL